MNKEIKEFKKYKKDCIKKLFYIMDENPLKKEIKKLEYSEDNLNRIKTIEEKLQTMNKVKENKFIYSFITRMLKSEKVDRFYKLLNCDNFINYNFSINEQSDYRTRSKVLIVTDTEWIKEENFELFLELVNNKKFLEKYNDGYSDVIKNKILNTFYDTNSKESIKNLINISTDDNFWNEYNHVEKFHILDLFERNKNNSKYTQLISQLSHKNYFKNPDDFYLGDEIVNYTKYYDITKRNIDGVIQLVNNLDSEEALKNIIKVKRVIEKISEIKSPKQSIELANIASNPKVLNKDVKEIERTLKRMENKEALEQLKRELQILSVDTKQKQYTKK